MELKKLLSEDEAAELLGVRPSWLRLRRWRGTRDSLTAGPPHVTVGKFVKYCPADLERWIEQNKSGGGEAA